MANVCVFCGARSGNDPLFLEEAYKLGEELAKRGHTLVYGGGNGGIMGAVAKGSINQQGKVIGVIPGFLAKREQKGEEITLSETITVESMDERKGLLFEKSDVIITLPGGVGTMDEFFEALTLRQLEQHEKPIGILNSNHFYTPLVEYMHHMVGSGFISVTDMELLIVREDIESLFDGLGL